MVFNATFNPIATNVASSNHAQAIQHVIKFASNSRSVISLGTPVSSINKTGSHDITEILLKVALNTINLNHTIIFPAGLINIDEKTLPV
jgi:hypothetical protein